MMQVIERLKTAARKRAAYHRTVAEIEAMSLDVALDLAIYRGAARRIAHDAIYGA